MNTLGNNIAVGKSDSSAVQFLSFTVQNETYGVDIMSIIEIRGWVDTMPLPKTPDYMIGVLNLRGIVVPIFDLRSRFGLGSTEVKSTNVVIVLSIQGRKFGILVDTVSDIITLDHNQISASPDVQTSLEDRFIRGIITSDDNNMVILLNVEALFSKDDISGVDQALKDAEKIS